jgi:DNA-binding NarL/FixJ family response regulator
MIRVLIVDDHAFVRSSLTAVLGGAADIEVVGMCTDGVEVPAAVTATRPHIVLMDLKMPLVSGTEATRALTMSHPETRVVVLTGLTSSRARAEAALAGAVGYLYKGGNPEELVRAVRAAASGDTVWLS